jgi:hypothetical protein
MTNYTETITITYGEQSENHVGMQQIGQMGDQGLSIKDLENARTLFENNGYNCELVDLNEEIDGDKAAVLIVRDGISALLESIGKNRDDMYQEQSNLNPDKQAYMYGRVVNKHARYNLCFSDFSQNADYQNKKGTVIHFNDVPLTKQIRIELSKYFGNKALLLEAEGNYYYDINKCGIGFHGDAERKVVIACRMGATLPIHYQWFKNGKPVGKRMIIQLNHGDLYAMSEKATGFDWKKKSVYTLRHATGCEKFLKIK